METKHFKTDQYVEDTTISHFLAQLKELAQDPNVQGIKIKSVTEWLTLRGYLIYLQDQYTGETDRLRFDAAKEIEKFKVATGMMPIEYRTRVQ